MTPPTKPPTDDRYRFLRGGTWDDSPASLVRAAYRIGNTPSVRDDYVGFRCAQRGARMPLTGG